MGWKDGFGVTINDQTKPLQFERPTADPRPSRLTKHYVGDGSGPVVMQPMSGEIWDVHAIQVKLGAVGGANPRYVRLSITHDGFDQAAQPWIYLGFATSPLAVGSTGFWSWVRGAGDFAITLTSIPYEVHSFPDVMVYPDMHMSISVENSPGGDNMGINIFGYSYQGLIT